MAEPLAIQRIDARKGDVEAALAALRAKLSPAGNIVSEYPGIPVEYANAFVLDAILAGACGYLLKDSSIQDLMAGIRAASMRSSVAVRATRTWRAPAAP